VQVKEFMSDKALDGGWLSKEEMDNFQKTTVGAKK
jgi:hypothetical protein